MANVKMRAVLIAFLIPNTVTVILGDGTGRCTDSPVLSEKSNSANICYEGTLRSTVTLKCNWDQYKFDVQFTTGPQSEQAGIESYDYTNVKQPQNANARFPRSVRNRIDNCEIPAAEPVIVSYDYPTFSADAADGEMVIVDGKLYYRRSILVRETIVLPDDCQSQLIKQTVVTLSCCADPQPLAGDFPTPPLLIACPLSNCGDSNLYTFHCGCNETKGSNGTNQNYYSLVAHSTIMMNEIYDWEVVGVTATLPGGQQPGVPEVTLSVNQASPLSQLGFEQCPSTEVRPFNQKRHYQFNVFEFIGHEGQGIGVQCKMQFCARDPLKNERNRPICVQRATSTCSRK